MGKKVFFLNLNICVGCHSCQYACGEKKGLDAGQWFRRVLHIEEKEYSGAYSAGCNHCEQPACVAVCPTGAMFRDEARGLVLHKDGICIGCGSCIWACPYGAVSLDTRKGITAKCDGCLTETEESREPFCVAACPTQSLRYLDEDELKDLPVSRPDLCFLPDQALTVPTFRISRKRKEREEQI